MSIDERLEKNSSRCGANVLLEFKSAVAVDAVDRRGDDITYLDLRFSGHIDLRLKSPMRSYKARSVQANELGCLFAALGLDFNDVPPCPGGWEEFVPEIVAALAPKRLESLYAKLTVNEHGYIVPGEGKCFSQVPDMEYSDQDLRFLKLGEPDQPQGHAPFENKDLPY